MMDALSFLRETDGASHILIFDDDPTTLDRLRSALAFRFPDVGIASACCVTEAVARIRAAHYNSHRHRSSEAGWLWPASAPLCTPVLSRGGRAGRVRSQDAATASTALEQGACALLTKSSDRDVLTSAITEAFRLRRANVLPAPWGTA